MPERTQSTSIARSAAGSVRALVNWPWSGLAYQGGIRSSRTTSAIISALAATSSKRRSENGAAGAWPVAALAMLLHERGDVLGVGVFPGGLRGNGLGDQAAVDGRFGDGDLVAGEEGSDGVA